VGLLWGPVDQPATEVLDISAEGDQAEIPNSEAETYANVEVSTSLFDLKVEVAINVGTTIILPVLDMGVHTNVGATTSLAIGQTTQIALGIGLGAEVRYSVGGT